MKKYRIYLDNCCFNRPYDDQSQLRVRFETQAKLYIQKMVFEGKIELAWSYILKYENSRNPFNAKKHSIAQWEELSSLFISMSEKIVTNAEKIASTGVKNMDALHIACAIAGNCHYFITVDKRLLGYDDNQIIVCNPIEFLNQVEK
jgi:predicted nucleic acid-binding protein